MNPANPKELFEYRINLIRTAMSHQKTERVPIMGNVQNWMYMDAGYTVLEAARDYEKCEDSGRKFVQKYAVDTINFGAGCVRNPTQLYDALGQNDTWAAAGDENNINAIFEDEMIKADEYDEMIEDYEKTIYEKALFRTFKKTKDFTLEQWVAATKAAKDFADARKNISAKLREEFGIADQVNVPGASLFLNNLMDTYRGLKGLSLDLRRQPDKVAAICEIRDEIITNAVVDQFKANPGKNMNEPYDVTMGFLAHILLTPKQFERFYLPGLDKVAKACEKYDKQMFLNTEADFLRFGDYFNNYKKGVINCAVEMDDPFEVRRKCPNIGIVGGLSVDIMGKGTPEQCIDMAKKAIDEIGCDGGLWLAPNKFVTYDYDMKSENLKAVCDFVLEYKA